MDSPLAPGGPEPFAASLNNPGLVRDAQQRAAAPAPLDWRRLVRRRALVLGVLLLLWGAGIQARLVYLQVVDHDQYVQLAERQHTRTIKIAGKRGALLDRHGRLLAYSVDGDAVFAEPPRITDRDAVARRVCEAIEGCGPEERGEIRARLGQRRAFVYLARRISPVDAERVRALDIRGIGIRREDRRYYPNRELAAHLLGFVGIDNEGQAGIELAFDERIAGRPGMVLLQTDARQNAFERVQRPPTEGASLELTIDQYLQFVAERELAAGVKEFGAKAGTIVIMDPRDGDILALANYPTFNPNAIRRGTEQIRRNRAVEDVYEPGSTFKIVTAAAALEERLVRPTDVFDVSSGSIRFGARVISDVHRYGALSFHDLIVKSSNVGAIKVGQRIGPHRLVDYVTRFGFGARALGDLRHETRGIVWRPEKLNDSALASVSMGYQVAVTPVQMAAAASAVANGGELVRPRVVRAVIEDGVRVETPRRLERRVISPATAATLTTIMEDVVEIGTAKAARIDGYTIAGKTGTAAKIENGRYSKANYNASFVGFLPSREPAVTVLVVIDSPRGRGYYGGAVAAPVFRRVAEATLQYLGIPPADDERARVLLARRVAAEGPIVSPASMREPLTASLDATPDLDAGDGMPDVRGWSARDAVRALARLGVTARARGDGVVAAQSLAPGAPLDPGATCVLTLVRRPAAAVAAAAAVPLAGSAPPQVRPDP
ncbi:MAG: PASTA domain-containing protein [Vicinamibacteraceae bacterium]|nr:PASTA domain-containing protein [Vicinamibacteraceae bacterium]